MLYNVTISYSQLDSTITFKAANFQALAMSLDKLVHCTQENMQFFYTLSSIYTFIMGLNGYRLTKMTYSVTPGALKKSNGQHALVFTLALTRHYHCLIV